MITLCLREINSFFNSLTGMLVMAVFLGILALFLWVFPGVYNITENGFATLDSLFQLIPFLFLFIIPALTMRFFSDEKKSGTIEMLLTKPVSDLEIIMAKNLAGFALVVISILPTLIFYLTVSFFALPPGVDSGGTWGSYLGLLFLGTAFISIGVFSSSLTENQIVSFIIALFFSGFFLFGFELIHTMGAFGRFDLFVRNLGIQSHYDSMSRGVVDSRNVLYFISVSAIFIMLTKLIMGSRQWLGRQPTTVHPNSGLPQNKRNHLIYFFSVLMVIVTLNVAGSVWFFRIDLTSDKRHTLTAATREMLRNLDDIVYFRVYLEGDFPAGFRRLRNQTREVLEEFKAYSDMIEYDFINPSGAGDRGQVQRNFDMLVEKGLRPTQIQVRADDATSQQLIFPGAIASYRDKEISFDLLQDHMGLPLEEMLNNSGQMLEYTLIQAIRSLIAVKKPVVGLLQDHAGISDLEISSLVSLLQRDHDVRDIFIDKDRMRLNEVDLLLVIKPVEPFLEREKFILDQYVMRGGRIVWLVDPVVADMDSLQNPPHEFLAVARHTNLDDMFFRYGVRMNSVLLMDLQSAPIPVTTGFVGDRPQINLLPWPFFPLMAPASSHPVVRNLNLVRSEFVSSIDTIETEGVSNTVLLSTSSYSRSLNAPAHVALRLLQEPIDERFYAGPPQKTALLVEGHFPSVFTNRIPPVLDPPWDHKVLTVSENTAMVFIGDADIVRNQIGGNRRPLPLGYDRYSGETFGNKDFIMNIINYLTDERGIMEARSKEVRLRLLDKTRMTKSLFHIQLINILAPLMLVFIFGGLRLFLRKRRYAKDFPA